MDRQKNGQTMVEMLVAVAIVVLVLVTVVSRVVAAVASANFARNQALSTRFSQEGLEWARSQRDSLGWVGFSPYISSSPTYCVPDLSLGIGALTSGTCLTTATIPGTIFLREVRFIYAAPGGQEPYTDIISTVSWRDRVGWHRSTLTTRLTRWNTQQ